METIEIIRDLEKKGILSNELCPEPGYWHWDVIQPENLPPSLEMSFIRYGEIRWYG